MVSCLNLDDIESWHFIEKSECPVVYDLSIQDNHNYFLDCNKHISVHNSGKTYATLQFIWANMVDASKVNYSVVRQSLPTLKGSVIPDFVEIGTSAGLYSLSQHNLSDNIYKHNGNEIHFFSGDNEEKLRGRKQDVLYLNEGPELQFDSVKQMLYRTTSKIIIDYNPSYPDSWVYSDILTRSKRVCFLRTTYKNNPFLSQRMLDELEWTRVNNPEEYLIYGLGQRGEIQGQVYSHWKRIKDEAFPKGANVFVLDFGFSDDPTVILRSKLEGRSFYFDQVVYETGLNNLAILVHLFFAGYNEEKGHILIADSANPKDISDLRHGLGYTEDAIAEMVAKLGYSVQYTGEFERLVAMVRSGVYIVGAIKGPGSIRSGIKKVKDFEIFITDSSHETWRESTLYKYKKDKFTGKYTLEPMDKDNHSADCIRYVALAEGRYFNY